jgi:hypothetical protein
VSQASIGFRLYTELGVLITSTSTWSHGIEIPNIQSGDGYIDLDIACLNLLPGRYSLSLWIAAGSFGSHVYDGLEHCARLEVGVSTAHASARSVDGEYGLVYFPQTWDLRGVHRGLEVVC